LLFDLEDVLAALTQHQTLLDKVVTVVDPLFVNESFESFERAIVRITEELRERSQQGRTYVALGAINENVGANFLKNAGHSLS